MRLYSFGLVLVALIALTAIPGTQSMRTCSRGSKEHDWIMFDDYPTQEDTEELIRLARTLLRAKDSKGRVYGEWAQQCLPIVRGQTIGFHDGGALNGVDNDDHISKRVGCMYPEYIHVRDLYARAAALMVCTVYANSNYRRYGLSVGSAIFTTMGRWTSNANRNSDCSSARTYNEIIDTDLVTNTLCWNFVQDVRDLAWCNMARYATSPAGSGAKVKYQSLGKTDYRYSASPYVEAVMGTVVDPLSYKEGEENPPYLVEVKTVTEGRCAVDNGLSSGYYRYTFLQQGSQLIAQTTKDRLIATKDASSSKIKPQGTITASEMPESARDEYDPAETMTTAGVQIEGISKQVCVGKKCVVEEDKYSAQRALMVEDKGAKDPKGVPYMGVREVPPVSAEKERSSSSGSSSWSRASGMSSTYSVGKSYYSLNYSNRALMDAAVWLEGKLGDFAIVLTAPLRMLASTFAALSTVCLRALISVARYSGLCPDDLTEAECMCDVVAPLMDSIDDIFRTPPPLDGDNAAVTLLACYSSSYYISAASYKSAYGLYVTFYWKIAGATKIGFDIGYYSSGGHAISIGTDIVSLGGTKELKFGLFFGLKDEISVWRKGINVGMDIGVAGKVGFELLFRTEYIDLDYKTRCAPIDYAPSSSGLTRTVLNGAGRFLLLPVNPVCVRGFMIAVYLGTGVGKVTEVNLYTSMEAMKFTSLYQWQKPDDSPVVDVVTQVITREKREKEEREAREAEARRLAAEAERKRQEALAKLAKEERERQEALERARREQAAREEEARRVEAARVEEIRRAREAEERRIAKAKQVRAQMVTNLHRWGDRAVLSSKMGTIQKMKNGMSGALSIALWNDRNQRLLVVEGTEIKYFQRWVSVKDKGFTGVAPAKVYSLEGATLTFDTKLATRVKFDDASLRFTVRAKDLSKSSVTYEDLEFAAQNAEDLVSWLAIIHNKISIVKAKAVDPKYYEQIDRFSIAECMYGHTQMKDNKDLVTQMLPDVGGMEGRRLPDRPKGLGVVEEEDSDPTPASESVEDDVELDVDSVEPIVLSSAPDSLRASVRPGLISTKAPSLTMRATPTGTTSVLPKFVLSPAALPPTIRALQAREPVPTKGTLLEENSGINSTSEHEVFVARALVKPMSDHVFQQVDDIDMDLSRLIDA